MKRYLSLILSGAAAILSAALVIVLLMSLVNTFGAMPTEYPNSSWQSEDGSMTLNVYEYDPNILQCRAELICGDKVYDVYDMSKGRFNIVSGDTAVDEWLRVSCDNYGFTVRINRHGNGEFSSGYEKNEKVSFNLISGGAYDIYNSNLTAKADSMSAVKSPTRAAMSAFLESNLKSVTAAEYTATV